MPSQTVAILGASDRPDRYAYMAFKKLTSHGHKTLLVNPQVKQVEGQKVLSSLGDIAEPVHTLTMYVGAAKSDKMSDEILKLKPGRVIFNPGSENHNLEQKLDAAGIPYEHACTLVLLSTDQF